ncbi:MAG: M48 family metallopeptidase [Bellilinea sp.]
MHQIEVDGLTVDIVRKNIRNLHLAVYPPNGRIRIAVPLQVSDDAVRMAVISKLTWIKRQQAKYQEQQRQSKREYVSGESHYFKGSRYLLNLVEGERVGNVIVRNKKYIDLYVRSDNALQERERIMLAWYRSHLRTLVTDLIEKWEQIIDVQVTYCGIKRMKTKWGACNIEARRIWVNLELAKKSDRCLEYIIVHEMVHLLERYHNDNFFLLMNKFLPQWRQYREELNHAPLAHEEWVY